jgi:AcrR family transcriptional regulator
MMRSTATATRALIVRAADDLFYRERIRSASMDAIAERTGITKRTLYNHFRSKDDLIAAYLEARDEPTLARYAYWLDETKGSLADQMAGVFRRLARLAALAK